MHDLLKDPLIGIRTSQGTQHVSLPGLLATLSAGRIESYTGLRAHQADPWHVFLVQLAASIQARHPTDVLPDETDYWRNGLLDLADGVGEAWHLVVEDVTKPAFLQHPWIGWDQEAADYGVRTSRGKTVFDAKAIRPDELDVLVTAKNHDVKMARIGAQSPEAWLYALLLLQTTSGFLGQGNYGIVRMNGGFASRSVMAWARSPEPASRFVDEVNALRHLRSSVCRDFHYVQRGIVLTWLAPWYRDDHHVDLCQLEPWFVEAARPIRLYAQADGSVFALGATSEARQIGPKTIDSGDVGDPWTPINVRDKKKGRSALTLSADGFTPQRMTDLLFKQGFELTPLQEPQAGDRPGCFIASCLARGQGTTAGFHRVEIPVPAKARIALFNRETRDTLGHLAQNLLKDAKDVQGALATALTILMEGGPEKADFERAEGWIKAARVQFGRQWEHHFFPTLWRGAEESHDAVRLEWQQRLVDAGQALLNDAGSCLPLPTNRRWRALTQSQRVWMGTLKKIALPISGRVAVEPTELQERFA